MIKKKIKSLISYIIEKSFLKKKLINYSYQYISNNFFDFHENWFSLNDINERYKDFSSIDKKYFNNLNKQFKKFYLITDLNDFNNSFPYLEFEKISTIDQVLDQNLDNTLFFIIFKFDDRAFKEIEKIEKLNKPFVPLTIDLQQINLIFSTGTPYRFTNELCSKALQNTNSNLDKISHFTRHSIITHENICEAIELTRDIPGDCLEIGVYKGGSALTFLEYLSLIKSQKKLFLIDTFEGFNYLESKNSIDVKWYKTHYISDSKSMIKYLKTIFKNYYNYEIILSNICSDNLPYNIKNLSLVNIDVDMYEATLEALIKVSPIVSPGGIIICEDSVHTPSLYGAYYAMEKFLKTDEGKKYSKLHKIGQYFLIKNR